MFKGPGFRVWGFYGLRVYGFTGLGVWGFSVSLANAFPNRHVP